MVCQFWDLGGAVEVRSLWARYYPDVHAVFFVIDSSDESRIFQAKQTFGKIIFFKKFLNAYLLENIIEERTAEGVPIAILANKQDLSNADVSLIKEVFNPLMPRVEARESKVFAVSAHTG